MKVLIVSPCSTHPAHEGNRKRVLTLAKAMQSAGHEVHFALAPNAAFLPGDHVEMRRFWRDKLHTLYPANSWTLGFRCRRQAAHMLRRLGFGFVPASAAVDGIDVFYLDWWNVQLASLQRRHQFAVVFAEYVFVSRALLAFPSTVLKVLDTHDVFSGRDTAIHQATGLRSAWLSTTAQDETRGLDRADVVLGIQADESAKLRQMTASKVLTVGHFLEVAPRPVEPRHAVCNHDILFVGSESSINVHGVAWLIEQVLGLVLRGVPSARLRVVGKAATALGNRCGQHPVVDLIGPVDDLAMEYANAAVVVNPVQFGTGLAIKSIEALAHGKTLVCTALGARGIAVEGDGPAPLVIADDPSSFAAAVVHLLSDPSARAALEKQALDFVGEWNKSHATNLQRVLEEPPRSSRSASAKLPKPFDRVHPGPTVTDTCSEPSPQAASCDPVISLVVCTRNRATYLPAALAAFQRMKFSGSCELILVDSASTDETGSLLSAAARNFKLRTVTVRSELPGLSIARNLGWRNARGLIVAFTDDDCYPQEDFLESIVRVFQAQPQLGYLGGRVLLHDPADLPTTIQTLNEGRQIPPQSYLDSGFIHGANFALKRTLLEQLKGFDNRLGAGARLLAGEDTDMLVRASASGALGCYDPTVVVEHHHRRQKVEELSKLDRGYSIGCGAYYAKIMMDGTWIDARLKRRYLREWYWRARSQLRQNQTDRLQHELRGALQYAWAALSEGRHVSS